MTNMHDTFTPESTPPWVLEIIQKGLSNVIAHFKTERNRGHLLN